MINTQRLKQAFTEMGARLSLAENAAWQPRFSIGVVRDGEGEVFDLRLNPTQRTELSVAQATPDDQRLVLTVDQWSLADRVQPDTRLRFVCGQERGRWFVAPLADEE